MIHKYYSKSNGKDCVDLLAAISGAGGFIPSAPKSFNDPFEFKVKLSFDADESVIKRRYFDDNPGRTDKDYQGWRQGLDSQFQWWLINDVRNKLLKQFRVICFTMAENNHLMWSHYACNHQGFCIGFDESRFNRVPGFVASGPIEYGTDAPEFNYYTDTQEDLTKAAFFHKSSEWAYEKEYRVVLDTDEAFAIGGDGIQEVLLGCRAYSELRSFANDELEGAGFPYFQMAEDYGRYSLGKKLVQKNTFVMSSHF